MIVSRKAWLKLTSALVMLPAPALAQSQASQPAAPSSTPAPAGDTAESGLKDIIVTAQQRGENLQKAAVPVAVVSGADLVTAGVNGPGGLNKLVPALTVFSSAQGNLVFIRGVGNFSFTPNSDPAAAFNIDGVYVGRSSSTFGTIYDLERIEVLKGPQGTLYGRNATAGAINILPVQPSYGVVSGYATASYGNFNALTAEGGFNLGLGEKAGLRISGQYNRHDGFLRDGTQGDDSGGVRAQLKVALTPSLTVRVVADYAHQGSTVSGTSYYGTYAFNAATGQFVVTRSGLPADEGLFSTAAQNYRTTSGTAGTVRLQTALGLRPYQNNAVYGVAYHIDWKTSLGTVSIIPAWRHGSRDNLSTDSAQQVGNTQKTNQYTVEARLVSNPGRLFDYILGAYYYSDELNDDTHTGAGVQNGYALSHYRTHAPAAYGRLTLHASDWLRLTGAVRYTEDHKTFDSVSTTLALVCTTPGGCPTAPLLPYTTTLAAQPTAPALGGGPVPVAPGVLIARSDATASGAASTSKVTYRGAVELDIGPRSMLYASVETGYRAGGFNPVSTFDPENIRAFTIGMKNRLFDNRLQLNIELFDWKYTGQQLSYLSVEGGRIGVVTHNVGSSSVRGVEVEGRALVTPTTTLAANVHYLDAKYDSFSYTSAARPISGCTTTASGTAFVIDCSGKPAISSPKWTINLGAEQRIPLGDYQIVLNADTQYRSSRYVGFEYIDAEFVDHSWTSNAQISFGRRDGKFAISAFVRNIENNRYTLYGTPVPASNLIVTLPAEPRLYGIRLSGRF